MSRTGSVRATAFSSVSRLLLAYVPAASLFVAYALASGQDANWDLQNYHDYVAYALLHWRYPLDVAPGGFQSYLNPLPYALPYLLRRHFSPMLGAALLAACQAIIAPIAYALAETLARASAPKPHVMLPVLAVLTGLTAAMAVSEIGTSFADLRLASIILGALLALLRSQPLVAGLLLGGAVGLKLSNVIFIPGLVAAALLVRPFVWRRGVHLAVGLVGGFMVAGAPWAAYLWITLGNPVFPVFNDVFLSASAVASGYREAAFLPHGLVDALAFPWRIARGEHPTAEMAFADPRLLSALVLGIAGVAGRAPLPSPVVRTFAFLVVTVVTWLAISAIQRYAIALDVLAGILIPLLACRLLPSRPRLMLAGGVAATFLVVALTRPADWWHRPWSAPFAFRVSAAAALAEPAAYLIVSEPNGYRASLLPTASRFYNIVADGIAPGGALRERITRGIAAPPVGGIRTIAVDLRLSLSAREKLAANGVAPAAPCVRQASLWWVDTVICGAARVGSRLLAAAELAPGEAVDFSIRGSGWIYLLPGWRNAGVEGTAMQAPAASVVLHTTGPGGVLRFTFLNTGIGALYTRVRVEGQADVSWTFLPQAGPQARTLGLLHPGTTRVTFEPAAPSLVLTSMTRD